MDLNKIGEFIAKERKYKNFTQKQLTDRLNVSDKTISKWECGKGFPEVSLLLPLCEELGLTVNELLTGERLAEGSYMQKAEENMVHFMREREENKIRMQLIAVIRTISAISFLTLLLVVCIYTETIGMPAKIILMTIACSIFAVGIIAFMRGGRTVGYYKCSRCGETFVPGLLSYTTGMNLVARRSLRCPHCGKRNWCQKVLTRKESDGE